MKCPRCGKQGATLWHQDGICEPGLHEVSIRHKCIEGEYTGVGGEVGSVTIRVSVRKDTMRIYEDD